MKDDNQPKSGFKQDRAALVDLLKAQAAQVSFARSAIAQDH